VSAYKDARERPVNYAVANPTEDILERMWDYMNALPPCPNCHGWGGSHSVVNGDLCPSLFSEPLSTNSI
jgi:hypothetical protein